MKTKGIVAILLVGILLLALYSFTVSPYIADSELLPHDLATAVKDQAKGLYSSRFPLIPIYVSVDDFTDTSVRYTIHYFPFGTVGYSFTQGDGYNMEKPLTRW